MRRDPPLQAVGARLAVEAAVRAGIRIARFMEIRARIRRYGLRCDLTVVARPGENAIEHARHDLVADDGLHRGPADEHFTASMP